MRRRYSLITNDCLISMAKMPVDCIDAIICDPPYGLKFMGKDWDHGVPGKHFWLEALRVAKPGAHLLAFGGTRTFHRLACAIEDVGWELRDCIMWVYGSGFPKSLDISKALDKAAGAERAVVGVHHRHGGGNPKSNSMLGGLGPASELPLTAPAIPEAKQWDGFGTALKPSYEPIIWARKPLIGTVAANVLKYGTGGINIDRCRVAHNEPIKVMKAQVHGDLVYGQSGGHEATTELKPNGRWPANFIHDGSDEVVSLFPEVTSGVIKSQHVRHTAGGNNITLGRMKGVRGPCRAASSGSASRFFYCAKASKKDRGENNTHPTVKPSALMAYLCKLITPPNGIILDPFMGSGTTGVAALVSGFNFIGIEKEQAYLKIAKTRIRHVDGVRRSRSRNLIARHNKGVNVDA